MSQPVAIKTIKPRTMLVGEATKTRLVFLTLTLSPTYSQGSAMAATGEWIDGLCCLKLTFASLDHAVHLQRSYLYLHRGYTNSTNVGAVVSLLHKTM